MLNSIHSLNRNLDHYSRAAGVALRSAGALGEGADPALRPVEPVEPDAGANAAGQRPSPPPDSLESASVELNTAEMGVRAAVALVRAENERLGSLLDVLA